MLKHGDRLVIGGNHYFKVLNPYDESCNVKLSTQAIDFEFAHQEILRIQEEKYILLTKIDIIECFLKFQERQKLIGINN